MDFLLYMVYFSILVNTFISLCNTYSGLLEEYIVCISYLYFLLYISSLNSPLIVFEQVHATSFQLICDKYKILLVIVSLMLMEFTRMKEDIHNMLCLFKVDPESPPDLTHLLCFILDKLHHLYQSKSEQRSNQKNQR